jgi:hypothetical protein
MATKEQCEKCLCLYCKNTVCRGEIKKCKDCLGQAAIVGCRNAK